MLRRVQKQEVVANLREKLARAQLGVLTEFKGLKVADITALRRSLKEAGGELQVVKNTLLKLAAADTYAAALEEHLKGPTAIALSFGDPVALAKVLAQFAKEKPDNLRIKAGVLGQAVLSAQEVVELSKLPAREVLLAQLLGTLQSVPASLVNVLAAVIRKFLYVLKAIEEKRAAG